MYEIVSETVSEDEKMLTAVIKINSGAVCVMNIPLDRGHDAEMNLWGNNFLEACFRMVFPNANIDGLNLTLKI